MVVAAAFGCSSTSDPGAGGQGGAAVGGGTSTGGGSAGAGLGGTAAGAGGSPAAAGSGGLHAGGSGGAAAGPTRADAIAAIEKACTTASMQCPQLNVSKCESTNQADILPETSPCFADDVAIFQCAAKLPPSGFDCIGDAMSPNPEFCMKENAATQACRADGGA